MVYVPSWFKLEDYYACINDIELKLDALYERRRAFIEYINHDTGDLAELHSAIEAVERAYRDVNEWEDHLNKREEEEEKFAAASRRQESIPYVLPADGRGVRVEDVEQIIVGDDDVTIEDVRNAVSSLVLRDETSGDEVHVSLPMTSWHVISAFIRGI